MSSDTTSMGRSARPGVTLNDLSQSTQDNITSVVSGYATLLRDIDSVLWHVVPLVLLVFGTFGNVMTVVVMRGMRGSQSTACLALYFTALAVCDQCLLVTTLLFFGVDRTFSWPPSFFYFDLLCIVPKFLWCTSGVASAWFLVAMTYQRVTAVISPHRVGILCTVRRGKFIVAIIVIFSLALNVHFWFSFSYWPEQGQCQYRKEYMRYLYVFEWLDLTWASMLPFVFLATGNSILVWQVVRSMQLSRNMRGGVDQKATSETDKVHSMSITLILTSAVFLMLTVPVCILDLFTQIRSEDEFSPVLKLVDTVFLFFWMSASASNFYLYLLSGRKFRQETKRYVCCFNLDDAK